MIYNDKKIFLFDLVTKLFFLAAKCFSCNIFFLSRAIFSYCKKKKSLWQEKYKLVTRKKMFIHYQETFSWHQHESRAALLSWHQKTFLYVHTFIATF